MTNLISIVVSIYNGESTLSRCIDSLINQTRDGYEVILVDDGSTDSSGTICDNYAMQHEFISVIHQKNGGLSAARKTGYLAAKGNYITFFDCDDYIAPHLIYEVHEAINKSAPDLILYDYYLTKEYEDPSHQKIGMQPELLVNFKPDVFAASCIAKGWSKHNALSLKGFLWARCIKRSVLSEDMFLSERLCYTEDILFNMMLSKKIHHIAYIEKPLYYYCVTNGSLTNRYRPNMWQMMQFRQEWIAAFFDQEHLWPLAKERYDQSCWSAIMIAYNNTCQERSYPAAKKEMNQIRNTQLTETTLNNIWTAYASLPVTQKIKYLLIRFRLYLAYYLITNRSAYRK